MRLIGHCHIVVNTNLYYRCHGHHKINYTPNFHPAPSVDILSHVNVRLKNTRKKDMSTCKFIASEKALTNLFSD